jgi:hypothetical protein
VALLLLVLAFRFAGSGEKPLKESSEMIVDSLSLLQQIELEESIKKEIKAINSRLIPSGYKPKIKVVNGVNMLDPNDSILLRSRDSIYYMIKSKRESVKK